jgi:diguanylate cyclase (GGDEF)-like protein
MTSIYQLQILRFIARMDKKLLSVLIIGLVFLIFWGDYLVGPLAPFTHFYIVPIMIAGLFLDKTSAIMVTILATIVGTPFLQQAEANYTPFQLWFNLFSDGTIFSTILILAIYLKNVLKELKTQANYDFLTNACSMRFFKEVSDVELANAFREKHPTVIVFIDLDNFKQVNDEFGHQIGDNLLVEVASSIKASLREGDLLGRMGGDEFAVLFQNKTKDQADALISRIKVNLMSAIAHFNTNVTFSFGVVVYSADKKTSIDSLLTLADSAMYSVKHSTKNAIKFIFA